MWVVRSQKISRVLGYTCHASSMGSCYDVIWLWIHLVQTAFRTKAMEVHPDQNQDDRGALYISFSSWTPSFFSCGCFLVQLLIPWTFLSFAEAAEEKFKEVVKSYEAIKLERKNRVNWCKRPIWSKHSGSGMSGISCNLPCITCICKLIWNGVYCCCVPAAQVPVDCDLVR